MDPVFLAASETWSLCRLLPVMIGHLIPEDDDHWLQLLDIMDIVCAPIVHKNTPAYLQVLVESNLSTFVTLYPANNVILKIHNLLHIARFIEK